MYANTVSQNPTYFLRAVELIKQARKDFNVPSENWPHPTIYSCGTPCERYYAEIWVDGMDWQASYWIIEEADLDNPHIYPLLVFYENRDREIFQDFGEFVKACMWYRRDLLWTNHDDLGYYTDSIWPFLRILEIKPSAHEHMVKAYFEHASQPRVPFLINLNFIPEEYRVSDMRIMPGGKL